jgi:hypothetical protein
MLNKKPHQVVTIDEFCKVYDLPKNEVDKTLFVKSK